MTDPESISLGSSLPQWMRSRPEVKIDNGTSFSPPAHDDSFFYIRYPLGQLGADHPGQTIQSLTDTLNDVSLKKSASVAALPAAEKPVSKHTEPCKMFMHKEKSAAPLPSFANVKNQTKPFGTDDGFDGEGAACGTSIVKVARQMVSGKSLTRGFTVANITGDIEAHPEHHLPAHPDDIHAAEAERYMSSSKYMHRRGSKSLPASPLGSPKSMRKAQPNPYFTTTQAPASSSGGWFLSGLLGLQRDVASSTNSVVSNISEEPEDGHDRTGSTQQRPLTSVPQTTGGLSLLNNPKVLKAKPSELREMNFWSPTSM